jgi:hypothetical protein
MVSATPGIVVVAAYAGAVDDAVTELAAYFHTRTPVPDTELARLTRAARVAGASWAAIAMACGVTTRRDFDGVVSAFDASVPPTVTGLLFGATQYALEKLTGSRRYPPLTWPCPACQQQVTDRAATGWPVHIQHGHAPGCARLADDQAANDALRQARLPQLIASSEPALGELQRHRLARAVITDCSRCGWHGYFHDYLATLHGDWATAVCDNCYADQHPAIIVTVRFFSARLDGSREPFAVIRERTRSDHRYPDIGQQLAWRLNWEHTTVLAEDARGELGTDIVPVSQQEAERIAASLAHRYWPPDAAQLPWVTSAYPPATPMITPRA